MLNAPHQVCSNITQKYPTRQSVALSWLFLEGQREWKEIIPFAHVKEKSKQNRKKGREADFLLLSFNHREILMNDIINIFVICLNDYFFIKANFLSDEHVLTSPRSMSRFTSQILGQIQRAFLVCLGVCVLGWFDWVFSWCYWSGLWGFLDGWLGFLLDFFFKWIFGSFWQKDISRRS